MRWAMIGRSPGNGHPYSWSAICNGYDSQQMRKLTEFPVIGQYLDATPKEQFGVGDAKVTHVWMPDKAEAEFCARCSRIANVVDRPEDVIGQVDAVVIATDTGETHLDQARPFLDAGLPVFLDKPLCLSVGDLKAFVQYRRQGARLMSCSSARFCPDFLTARDGGRFGRIRNVNATVPHKWETYGIHGVEALYLFMGAAAVRLATLGSQDSSVTAIEYPDGRVATVTCAEGGFAGLWLEINGSADTAQVHWKQAFVAFRDTLRAFYQYITTGSDPYPFDETVELTKIIAAGLLSRQQGGKTIEIRSLEV